MDLSIANVLVDENQDLVNYLESNGVVINGCADNRCPTGNMEKGKAIANAYLASGSRESAGSSSSDGWT